EAGADIASQVAREGVGVPGRPPREVAVESLLVPGLLLDDGFGQPVVAMELAESLFAIGLGLDLVHHPQGEIHDIGAELARIDPAAARIALELVEKAVEENLVL